MIRNTRSCHLLGSFTQNSGPVLRDFTLADLGGMPGTCHPLWDPVLSFSHTFSLKSTHIGGPDLPNGCTPRPTGNPGSATVLCFVFRESIVELKIILYVQSIRSGKCYFQIKVDISHGSTEVKWKIFDRMKTLFALLFKV